MPVGDRNDLLHQPNLYGYLVASDLSPQLRAGVITGTPEVFCAGTGLGANADLHIERGGEYSVIRRKRTTPLIAAVEGAALGPEARHGVVATSGGGRSARRECFRVTSPANCCPPDAASMPSGRSRQVWSTS